MEAVADGPVDECGCDGGVDSAAEGHDDLPVSYAFPQRRYRIRNEMSGRPVAGAPAGFYKKVADQLPTVFRMEDFRVELEPIQWVSLLRLAPEGCDGDAVGRGQYLKCFRQGED